MGGLDSNERMLPLRSVEGHCLRYAGGGKRLEQMAKVWIEREFPLYRLVGFRRRIVFDGGDVLERAAMYLLQ